MISEETLKIVGDMLSADDYEMKQLGNTILMDSNPTGEDLENLYVIRGGVLLHYRYMQAIIDDVLNSEYPI